MAETSGGAPSAEDVAKALEWLSKERKMRTSQGWSSPDSLQIVANIDSALAEWAARRQKGEPE